MIVISVFGISFRVWEFGNHNIHYVYYEVIYWLMLCPDDTF